MNRFFLISQEKMDKEIVLDGENAAHIATVLRLRQGERIIVCDGKGMDSICELTDVQKKYVCATVLEQKKNLAEPSVNIILYQGMPKSDKMDWIIQKCVEVGVSEIVPVQTERSVAKWLEKGNSKIERFSKISEAAAKQSHRGVIPIIKPALTLRQAIADMKRNEKNIVAYENEKTIHIKQFLKEEKVPSLGVFIGPEGGFSEQEIEQLQEGGVKCVGLGERILRTETAGIAAIVSVLYEWEDM